MSGASTSAPIGDAEVVEQHPGRECAHHVLRAMREIDDVEHAEDDGEAEAQHGVEGTIDEPEQKLPKSACGGTPNSSNMVLLPRRLSSVVGRPSDLWGSGNETLTS